MATANANTLQRITHGVACDDIQSITVHETNECVHCIVSPKENADITLHFAFPENGNHKSYCIEVDFHHPNAKIRISGLYQLCEKQKANIKTIMNHHVPHCVSEQQWRGVLQDESEAFFEGTIVVHEKAQKTDATLSNKNLLLSPHARVNTRPQLQIYADDVKCAHGATVGCLDENALFYLRSRGIAENEAREMLVEAFVEELENAHDF